MSEETNQLNQPILDEEVPFPGLRPFKTEESHLFFGREAQTEELLKRLHEHRFVAVVGTSGSGKSSLVKAGLIPTLNGGFITDAGSKWRVAIFRPGNAPIANLADALHQEGVFEDEDTQAKMWTEVTLRRGSLGLVEAVQIAKFPPDENLLVIVDQFEELFRFKQVIKTEGNIDPVEESAAFVKLLLEAIGQPNPSIYVILTMRSDYLGDCSQFRDLPEAINKSEYLVPRMNRDERRLAILGPLRVVGSEITPPLVNQLLNDLGDNPDQLPVLQHALLRTWQVWKEENRPQEPIDLCHYEKIGEMTKALSNHANEIYDKELIEEQKEIAKKLFKCLTEKAQDNHEIRRPTKLSDISAIIGVDESKIIEVVDVFRKPGRSFLMPPFGEELTSQSILDISHESLIRGWDKLKGWVNDEAEKARFYRRLVETIDYQKENATLDGLELDLALKWKEENNPNQAWANIYDSRFESVMDLIDRSEQKRKEEQEEKTRKKQEENERKDRQLLQTRILLAGIALPAFAAILSFLWAVKSKNEAIDSKNKATVAEQQAKELDLKNTIASSKVFGKSGNTLQALVESIRAAKKIRKDDNLRQNHEKEVKNLLSTAIDNAYKSGEYNRLSRHKDAVRSVSFSQDGKLLASGGRDGKVIIWNFDKIKGIGIFSGKEYSFKNTSINSVDINNRSLVSGASRPDDRLLNYIQDWKYNAPNTPNNPTNLGKGNEGGIMTLQFFRPDNQFLAWGTESGMVNIFNLNSGLYKNTLDLKTIVYRGEGKGKDYNCLSNEIFQKYLSENTKKQNKVVYSIAFIDDKNLAIGRGDWCIWLWNYQNTKPKVKVKVKVIGDHDNKVRSLSFNQKSNLFASGGEEGAINIYKYERSDEDLVHITTIEKKHGGSIRSVSFSKDGKYLASGSEDGTIRIWIPEEIKDKLYSKEAKRIFTPNAIVYSVSYSPDGEYIASGQADGTVRIWKTNLPPLPKSDADIDSLVKDSCAWVQDYLKANAPKEELQQLCE